MEDRVEHHERRAAGLLAVRRVRSEMEVAFRPRCRDCRFGPLRPSDPDRCEHFVHWQISPERKLRIPVTTEQARSTDGLCGPDAMLFEGYSGWRSPLRWLAKQEPQTAAMWLFYAILLAMMGVGALILTLRGLWA